VRSSPRIRALLHRPSRQPVAEGEPAPLVPASAVQRWWGLAALVALEVTLFLRRFDGSMLHTLEAPWTRLFVEARILVPWGIALVVSFVLFARKPFVRAVERHGCELTPAWPGHALFHAFAFLGSRESTRFLFDAPPIELSTAVVGMIAWCTSGAVLVGTLLLLVLPLRVWGHLLRHGATNALVGVVLGVAALLAPHSTLIEPGPLTGALGRVGLACFLVGTHLWIAHDRLRFPRALVLYPIGILAVLGVDALRSASPLVAGAASFDVAERGAWALACAAVLVTLACAEWSASFRAPERAGRPRAVPRLSVLLLVLAVAVSAQLLGGFLLGRDDVVAPFAVLFGVCTLVGLGGRRRELTT
jgi:hypothetical protein